MITMNDKELKNFEADLKTFAHRAYPFATKNTVNAAAFATQKTARKDVRKKMIVKNRFSQQSIQVDRARTLNVNRQMSTVGSIADYMETQEFGGAETGGGKHGRPIPTSFSADQGKNNPRTKLPVKEKSIRNVQLSKKKPKGSKSRKRLNKMIIQQAAESGRKFVFLDLGKTKGIFEVKGNAKRQGIKMVYDISRKSVIVPRNPWLSPAVEQTKPLIPGIYKKSLEFQLKRNNLFRG